MKVAIPRMGETVAPCFEYSATIAVYSVEEGKVVDQIDFPIHSSVPFDRVRLLRDQNVDTIICGGVQDVFEDMLKGSGMELISWVSGSIESLLGRYLQGRLEPGHPDKRPTRIGRMYDKDKRS